MSLTMVSTVHRCLKLGLVCTEIVYLLINSSFLPSPPQPLVPTKQISASPIETLESTHGRAESWPTSLEKVHGEVVNFLFDLRRLLADEQAMLRLARDAEEQGVLGNIPVSSSDDRRIQLCPLTLTHLSRSKPAG